jgi:predicted amidohydrolase
VGNDPVCQYDGGTVAVSPYGKVIAECGDTAEEGCVVELDKESLNAFRKKFPVLLDRDEFSLIR